MDRSVARAARRRAIPAAAPLDERHDPVVRRRLSAPAMRTFLNIAAAWTLSVNDQRGLLGWPAPSTFHKYKAGDVGALAYDTLVRLSLILGIYKALHVLYPERALADGWVRLPNTHPLFGGRPALALMIDAGIDGLTQVRRLLDARRGGV
jgi:antitoxin Xre/MbcA/ParS-like protein